MSADSLAMSTAVSTEMPTSAALQRRAVVDAVAEKADDVALAVQRAGRSRSFCAGESLANTVRALGGVGQLGVVHLLDLRCRAAISPTSSSDLAADLARDDVVVAGQDLDRDAVARRAPRSPARRSPSADRGRRCSRAASGRSRPRRNRPPRRVELLVGDGDDAEAVRVERDVSSLRAREVAVIERADRRRRSRSAVQTAKISSTAPLQIRTCLSCPCDTTTDMTPAREIERNLVDLARSPGRC